MTARVFPVDAVSGAPAYSGRALRQLLGALAGGKTSRPLGGLSGVSPGTPTSTVTSTSSTWTVTPHGGLLDVEAAAQAGPYLYSIDANVTGSVNAADATHTRIDLISVQLSDPAESDGTSVPSVDIIYTPGTAASSPSPPASPARSINLAQITVPPSGSPTVTWVAPYTAAAGGIVPCANSGAYPSSPYKGLPIYDLALQAQLIWNGSRWASPGMPCAKIIYDGTTGYSPADSNTTNPSVSWNSTLYARGGITTDNTGITVAAPGIYAIKASNGWVTNGTGRRGIFISVNGSIGADERAIIPASSDGSLGVSIAADVQLAAGDLVGAIHFQDSGSPLALQRATLTVALIAST